MDDPRFPLGVPIRQPSSTPKPERQEVRKGIFSIDGKLQTELKIKGPRKAPETFGEHWDGLAPIGAAQ